MMVFRADTLKEMTDSYAKVCSHHVCLFSVFWLFRCIFLRKIRGRNMLRIFPLEQAQYGAYRKYVLSLVWEAMKVFRILHSWSIREARK
jgi:hypothetical protein